MELTKEDFERILDQKLDLKLDNKFAAHTKEIKAFIVEHVDYKIDSLAVLINNGFQNIQDQLNNQRPHQPWKSKAN